MADVITRFKLETTQYDSKLRDASKALADYTKQASVAGNEFGKFTQKNVEAARALGNITPSATNAKDKVKELVGAFNDVARAYNSLTKEQQSSDFGKAMAESMTTLKGRITEAKQELYNLGDATGKGKFGEFGNIINTLGNKLGVAGNLTEILTSKTALMTAGIGASIAVIGKATSEWKKYNDELAKQDQITTVTTGLKDDAAKQMTDQARALSDTYKVDFREAINAANTLMSQFGESGGSAIALIRDGMQGMIQGDGGKLLSMIQQYAPAFRDAGVSASQLVAVIQNSEGGIFTDQNMQAIVMGIKNIRLMTNSTSEALEKLGIDGQKMSEQMSNGTITVFDALKKVAAELQTVDSNSKTAGEVMQTVFGRQGAMAGTNLAKAIEGLNTNLEETKKQTGEVGDAFDDLYEANLKLNTAIRDAFSYDGWEQMATGIKSKLVTALAEVVGYLAKIRQLLSGDNTVGWNITPKPGVVNVADDPNVDDNGNYIRKPTNNSGMSIVKTTPTPPPTSTTTTKTTKGGSGKTEPTYATDSIAAQQALVQQLTKQWNEAGADVRDQYLQPLVEAEAKLKEMQNTMALQKAQAEGKLNGVNLWQGDIDDITGGKRAQFAGTLPDLSKSLQLDNLPLAPLQQLNAELQHLHDLLEKAPNTEAYQAVLQAIIDKKKQIEQFTTGNIDEGMNDSAKSAQAAASAFNQVGSALSSIEDPSAKVMSIVAQAIATIAQAYASALAADKTTKSNIWAFIGAAAASVASMVTTISQVHAATGYERGGEIKGNTYSGDQIPIMANAGEVVLTRAMAGNLASQLQGGGLNNLNLTATIKGEDIRLAINNNGRRTGRGEYVTTRFR